MDNIQFGVEADISLGDHLFNFAHGWRSDEDHGVFDAGFFNFYCEAEGLIPRRLRR